MLHDQSREFGALAQHRDVLQALAAPTSVESHKHSSLLCEWDMSLSLKIVDLVHCSNSSVRGSLQAQPDECFAMCQNLHILDLRIPTAVEIKSTEKSSTWLGGNGEQRQRTTAFQSLPLCTHRTAGSLLTGCDERRKTSGRNLWSSVLMPVSATRAFHIESQTYIYTLGCSFGMVIQGFNQGMHWCHPGAC